MGRRRDFAALRRRHHAVQTAREAAEHDPIPPLRVLAPPAGGLDCPSCGMPRSTFPTRSDYAAHALLCATITDPGERRPGGNHRQMAE